MNQSIDNKALSLKEVYGVNYGIGNADNENNNNSFMDFKQVSLNPNETLTNNLRTTKILKKENNKLKLLIHRFLEQELNDRKITNNDVISKFKTSGFKKTQRKSNFSVNSQIKLNTEIDRQNRNVEAEKKYLKKKKSIKMIFEERNENEQPSSSNNSPIMNPIKKLKSLEGTNIIEKKVITNEDYVSKSFNKKDSKSFSNGINIVEECKESKDKDEFKKESLNYNPTFPRNPKRHSHRNSKDKKRILRKPQRIVDSIEDIQDEDKLDLNSPFFISPNSNFKRLWDIMMSIFTLYILIIEPLYIAFGTNSNTTTNVIEISMDFLFIVDLFINFFVPYIDHEDELVCNHKMIAKNYIFGWFAFDFLSSIPSSTILYFVEDTDSHTNKIIVNVQLMKFSRLYKVLKLTRVFKFVENFGEKKLINNKLDFIENLNLSSAKKRMFSFIFTFLLSTHILSCIWIFLAIINPGLNWITQFQFSDDKSYEIYITSLYYIWASVFTVGYGDVYAVNSAERIFSILIMMIGVLIYSYAVSSLGNMITTYDSITTRYMTNMNILNELRNKYPSMNNEDSSNQEKNCGFDLKEKEILNEKSKNIVKTLLEKDSSPQSLNKKPAIKLNLYEKLSRFFKYDYLSNKFEKLNFIQELPFNVRNELLFKMYENIFTSFPFFKFSFGSDVNYSFNARIILSMKPIKVYKHEYIITEGEYVEEMFLVNYGFLSVELGTKYDFNSILVLRKYDHFGDIMVLSNEKSELNVKVKSSVAELYLIKKKDLFDISFEFPEIFKEIYKISKRNYLKLKNIIEMRKLKQEKNLHLKKLREKSFFLRKPDKNKRGVVFKSYENETQDISNKIISFCKQFWDSNNLSDILANNSFINDFQSNTDLINRNNFNKDQLFALVKDKPVQLSSIGVLKKLEDSISYNKKINNLIVEDSQSKISMFNGNNQEDNSRIIFSSNHKVDDISIDHIENNKMLIKTYKKESKFKTNIVKGNRNILNILSSIENSSSTRHLSKMNSNPLSKIKNKKQTPIQSSPDNVKQDSGRISRFGRKIEQKPRERVNKSNVKTKSNQNLPSIIENSINSLKIFNKKEFAVSLSRNIKNNLLDNLEIETKPKKFFCKKFNNVLSSVLVNDKDVGKKLINKLDNIYSKLKKKIGIKKN